jgi:MFS family permease
LSVAAATGCVTALAPSFLWLVVARGLQGVGFGLAMPQVLATIHSALGPDRRVRALMGFSAVTGVGTTAGVVIGGLLVSAGGPVGWRIGFGVVAAITVAALLGARFVPSTSGEDRRRVDLLGAVLIGIALVALVGGLSVGPALHWWPMPALLLAVAVVFGAAFFLAQSLRDASVRVAALLPPPVLKVTGLRYGMLLALTFFAGYGAFMYDYSTLTQGVFGQPAWLSGLGLLCFSLAFFAGSLAAPRVAARWGAHSLSRAGWLQLAALVLVVAGCVLGLTAVPWLVAVQIPLVLLGFVQALQFGPLVSTIMDHVPAPLAGLTGGLLSSVQQAALALGVAVIGGAYTSMSAHIDPVLGFIAALGLQALATVAFIVLAVRLRRLGSAAGPDHAGRTEMEPDVAATGNGQDLRR